MNAATSHSEMSDLQLLAHALRDAVMAGDVNAARNLLEQDAPTGIRINGRAPIHEALLRRDMPMLRLLIDYGSPLDIKTQHDEYTPLAIAAHKLGSLEFSGELLSAGASPFLRSGIHGQTPRQMVMGMGNPPTGLMHLLKTFEQMPVVNLAKLPPREAMETHNEIGHSLASHPYVWRNLAKVNAVLETRGEAPFDKAWLLQKHGRDGHDSRLHYALDHAKEYGGADRVLAGALHALEVLGTPLEQQELVVDGVATPLLVDIVKQGAAAALFSEELWLGRSLREFKALHRAAEDVAPVEVDHYHALISSIAQHERSQRREASR